MSISKELLRYHRWAIALMVSLFFASCATAPVMPPETMPAYEVKDLEWIANQKDFHFFFPIDRYQCDPTGEPLVKTAVDTSMCEYVSFEYLQRGAFKKVGGAGKFTFRMNAGESFKYIMPVELCDLSCGLAVSFLFNSNVITAHNISLKIADHKNSQIIKRSQVVEKQDQWQRIYFDLKDFNEIDLDAITTVTIIVAAIKPVEGEMMIDNVFVLGEKFFTQRSKEDNFAIFEETPQLLDKEGLLHTSDNDLLLMIARNTWQYFATTVDKETHIPADRIDFEGPGRAHHFTSTTNMGMYMVSCIAAHKLGFITQATMLENLKGVLTVIQGLERWNGFFYNYYHTTTLESVDPFVSSIDNGWLAIALSVVREVVNEDEKAICTELLDAMDFNVFYKEDLGHLTLGYDTVKQSYSQYDYGLLCSEARATSFFAIGKGDLPLKHWFKMYRTFPPEWEWQNGKPYGKEKYFLGEKIFSGFYVYENLQIVPSWGGSMFEFLMPTLFIDEEHLAAKGLGKNNKRAVVAHMRFAASQGYEVWGISPCASPDRANGGYAEYGVAPIGVKGYPDEGVITPHASILALSLYPEDVMLNIRNLIEKYPDIFTQYGFFDSININTNKIAKTYLCLDQAMVLVSICNYLTDNKIVELFHQTGYAKNAERVLKIEDFY
ncbi:MAG: DUF3131 domain-containing protein [Candidatus Omnitrophica bacterium]|nr:DUF3131 domain-containing protein [Candidatus Omnitrophota bacterium]